MLAPPYTRASDVRSWKPPLLDTQCHYYICSMSKAEICRSKIRLPRDITNSYIPYPRGWSEIRVTSQSEASGVGRAEAIRKAQRSRRSHYSNYFWI